MIVDVVAWRNTGLGCSRCAGQARYYVSPYYEPDRRVCPTCCIELARMHDEHGWPQHGRADM